MPLAGTRQQWRHTVPLWKAIAIMNQLAFPHPIAIIPGVWAWVVWSARRATPQTMPVDASANWTYNLDHHNQTGVEHDCETLLSRILVNRLPGRLPPDTE